MLSINEVINELIENKDYRENLEEMLEKYFEQNRDIYKSWHDWFDGCGNDKDKLLLRRE